MKAGLPLTLLLFSSHPPKDPANLFLEVEAAEELACDLVKGWERKISVLRAYLPMFVSKNPYKRLYAGSLMINLNMLLESWEWSLMLIIPVLEVGEIEAGGLPPIQGQAQMPSEF